MATLQEASKDSILSRARRIPATKKYTSKGIISVPNRYQKRLTVHLSDKLSQYNNIDVKKLFSQDILDIPLQVSSSSNAEQFWTVVISFSGVLKEMARLLKTGDNEPIKPCVYSVAQRAVNTVYLDSQHVYVRCECPDWQYRFSFFAQLHDIAYGDELEKVRPDQTNPDDTLGPACKHVLAVLSNTGWVQRVGSTLNNYINFVKDHREKDYAKYIFPKLYPGKDYNYQMSLFDDSEDSIHDKANADTIDKANVYGRNRTKFQTGNTQGIRFAKKEKPDPNQMVLDYSKE